MFVVIALAVTGFIVWLALHEWSRYFRLTPKKKRKLFEEMERLLALEKWQRVQKLLASVCHLEEREVFLISAKVLRGTKELDRALEAIVRGKKLFPNELLFKVEEGKIYLEMEKYELSYKTLEEALPILREEKDLTALARAYLKAGHPNQAYSLLQPMLKEKESYSLLILMGECLMGLNEHSSALIAFEKALKIEGETHALLTFIALALKKLGRLKEAEEQFQKILAKHPEDAEACLGFSSCLQGRGLTLRALVFIQSSKAWEKEDSRLLFQAGRLSVLLEKYEQAVDAFQKIRDKGEISSLLLSLYGFCLERLERWKEAEEIYLLALNHFPNDPQVLYGLSWLFAAGFSKIVSEESGVKYAEKLLSLGADSHNREILSAALARCGNFTKALQIQEDLAALDRTEEDKRRREKFLSQLKRKLPLDGGSLQRKMMLNSL